MGSREQQRADASVELARTVRSPGFRSLLTEVRPGARRTVAIAALPDDTLAYVWSHLDREPDAVGVLTMVGDTDETVVLLWPASRERSVVAEENGRLDGVHDDCDVDMFMRYLKSAPEPVVVRRIAARVVRGDQLTSSGC